MGRATKVFLFHPSMYPAGVKHPFTCTHFFASSQSALTINIFQEVLVYVFCPIPTAASNFHPSVSFIKVILSVVHEDSDMYPCANWCRVTFDPLRTGSDCHTPSICRKNVKKLLDFVFTLPCVYPDQGNLGIKQTQGRELVYNVMSGKCCVKSQVSKVLANMGSSCGLCVRATVNIRWNCVNVDICVLGWEWEGAAP